MDHLGNAGQVLLTWQAQPQPAGLIRGFVYDAADRLAYTADYLGAEWGGIDGVASQLGKESSLFTQSAAYFALVADLCIYGTERTRAIWWGSQRGGTAASASIYLPDSLVEDSESACLMHRLFWNAYIYAEQEAAT